MPARELTDKEIMKYRNTTAVALVTILSGLFAGTPISAFAATAVSEEPGFSGFFNLGVSAIEAKTNLYPTFADDEIDNINDSPSSNSSNSITPGLSLVYTFDNLTSEVFLGNSLEDFVRFDFSTVVGFRQQVPNAGIFEFSVLATPGSTELWQDPYAVGVDRKETDRSATGLRFEWGEIMGSRFDFRISNRESDIDDEKSGEALLAAGSISMQQQASLDRNGDITSSSLLYNWDRGKKRLLSLDFTYLNHDLDGEAMSFDGYSLQFSYVSPVSQRMLLASNVLLGRYEHDAENPLYQKKNDKDLAALTLTLFLRDPLGATGWLANVTLAYAQEKNEIEFYDTTLSMINVGMLRRF